MRLLKHYRLLFLSISTFERWKVRGQLCGFEQFIFVRISIFFQLFVGLWQQTWITRLAPSCVKLKSSHHQDFTVFCWKVCQWTGYSHNANIIGTQFLFRLCKESCLRKQKGGGLADCSIGQVPIVQAWASVFMYLLSTEKQDGPCFDPDPGVWRQMYSWNSPARKRSWMQGILVQWAFLSLKLR